MMLTKKICALVLLSACCYATAYEAGDYIVRLSATTVSPDASSSALSLNSTPIARSSVDVHSDTQLGITGVYMISDHLGLELLASTPFKHDIKANTGALGLGTVDAGSVKHLPPTLSLQYYPAPSDSMLQPFMSIGVNYTLFFEEEVSSTLEGALASSGTLKIDDSIGISFELGVDYQVSKSNLINFTIWYLDISTDATYSFNNGNKLTADIDIDPLVYSLSIGHKY